MSEKWHADITITDALVTNCLTHQFPTLPIQTLRCIGEGWDNKVYLINEEFIFRFPRRNIAIQLIERENAVLTKLQSIQEVAIPNPIYLGNASEYYPYPFHGYRMISGQSGCHAYLTPQQRIASIVPLTAFLKQLHQINATQALALGAKPQVFDRTDVHTATTTLTEVVQKIIARKIAFIDMSIFQNEIDTALQIPLAREEQCLIHGDLYCRHLMFNEGQLRGIIDWGDVGINNKAVDLAVLWSFYPSSCHAYFLTHYGEVDPATWAYARFLGIYGALTILLYAFDTHDTLLAQEAMQSINRINPHLFSSST